MKCSAFDRAAQFGFILLIVVLAGLGTAHILARTASYGAAIDGDSVSFLSVAMNVLADEGYRDFAGSPMTGWPPLFPLLLVALGWVGIEPLEAGRWINAAAFGLTILAAGLYLRSNLRWRGLALVASVAILASLPLSEFAARFLTDSLFALLTLLALTQLASFLQRGGRTPLYGAASFAALAALTRYPGVVLIGAGVLLLLVRRARPLAARLKDASAFAAVSSLPLAGVLAYNYVVSETLTGPRKGRGSEQSLSDGLSQIAEVFGAWIVPSNAPEWVAYLLWLAVGLVGLAGVAVVLRNRPKKPPAFGLGPAVPCGVFALMYLVFMLAVVPLTVGQPIDSRYLLPIYMPLLLAAVFLLDRFLSIEATGWLAAIRFVLAALVLLASLAHSGFSLHSNLHSTRRARTVGYLEWTYNSRYWERSESLHYIRDTPIDGQVYSNNFFLAWFWDRTAALGKHARLPHNIHHLTSAIMRWTNGDGAYILWLRNEKCHAVYAYDDFDLRYLPGVEPVAELADGAVFRITAAEPFDAAQHRARKQRYVQQLLEQAGEPVVRADWDVYLNERTLTYRKQPCTPADAETRFVLQVIPVNSVDLPADRQQYGFDLLDFHFRIRGGVRLDDQCVATAHLPDYPIGRVYIGQWTSNENRTLWDMAAKPLGEARYLGVWGQRYVDQLIEQASERVGRAGWDVYRNDRTLIYRKQPCAPADVQAKLVLHTIPSDLADLPAGRMQHGYDALGFYFDQRGFRLDDQCIAIAQLPDYPIGRIQVGQWIANKDSTVWEAEFAGAED